MCRASFRDGRFIAAADWRFFMTEEKRTPPAGPGSTRAAEDEQERFDTESRGPSRTHMGQTDEEVEEVERAQHGGAGESEERGEARGVGTGSRARDAEP